MYKAIFENSKVGMIVFENDGSVNLVNKEAEKLLGYSQNELKAGIEWESIFLNKESVDWLLNYENKDKKELDGVYETDLRNKGGEVRTVLFQTGIIPIHDNNFISLVDITARKRVERKIKHKSYHDQLTGVCNRAYYEKMLYDLDREENLPISIIICDNNGLKLINDIFGHDKGDELIKKAADVLQHSVREDDIVARWGGDEFGIILSNTPYKGAERVIRRINEKCKEFSFNPISLSIALGAATKTTVDQSRDNVVARAESRMYDNKLETKKNIEKSMIISLEGALLALGDETREHMKRIERIVLKLGKALNLTHEYLDDLTLLARFHDIGKLVIPEKILMKSEPLIEEEWEQVKKHCEIGYRLATNFKELTPCANNILHHHEWWDGTGYPDGLKKNEIPLLARIINIADAYDVMTNGKPYQKFISHQEAIKNLKRGAGRQFDPYLVNKFIEVFG